MPSAPVARISFSACSDAASEEAIVSALMLSTVPSRIRTKRADDRHRAGIQIGLHHLGINALDVADKAEVH